MILQIYGSPYKVITWSARRDTMLPSSLVLSFVRILLVALHAVLRWAVCFKTINDPFVDLIRKLKCQSALLFSQMVFMVGTRVKGTTFMTLKCFPSSNTWRPSSMFPLRNVSQNLSVHPWSHGCIGQWKTEEQPMRKKFCKPWERSKIKSLIFVFKPRAPPERLAKAAYLSHHALFVVISIISVVVVIVVIGIDSI